MARSMLAQVGLRQALDAGRVRPEAVDWFRALLNHTDTLRNEIRAGPPIKHPLNGLNESILLGEELLGRIQVPTLFIWGAQDVIRMPGSIAGVVDTGTTINENPRLRIRVRCEPAGREAFELEQKMTVPRIRIPRQGDRIEVAYDPEDPTMWVFRLHPTGGVAASSAEPSSPAPPLAPDRLAQLEKLAELRERGALSDEEFEAEKRRVLDTP